MSARRPLLSSVIDRLFGKVRRPALKRQSRRAFLEQLERRELLTSVPVAINDPLYATPVNTNLVISAVASGVVNNDFDPESAALSASVVTNPANGSLSGFSSNGTFTYVPNNNFSGIDTFTYKVNDGTYDSNTATVTIAVGGNFGPRTNLDTRIQGNLLDTGAATVVQPLTMGLNLIYRSDTDPRPVVIVETSLNSFSSVPNTIDAVLTFGGVGSGTISYNTTGLAAGDKLRFVLQVDASSLSTGMYDWTVQLTANFTGSSASRSYTGKQAIVNRNSSEFGRNWWLDGLDSIVASGSNALLVRGNGETLWFAGDGAGGYLKAEGDLSYSTLVKNGDNTYALTDWHGNKQNFGTDGKLTSIVDHNDVTTSFTYSSGKLSEISDHFSRDITFSYTSGMLTGVTDFASRTVDLSHTSGKLMSVSQEDPDGGGSLTAPVWEYTYDGSTSLLTNQEDPLDHDTGFAYNATSKRLSTVTHHDTTTWSLVPSQTEGLKTGSGNSIYKPTDVDARYTDERGKVWRFVTDRLGNLTSQTIPISGSTTATTASKYDQNGRLFKLTEADPDDTGPLTSPVTILGYESDGDLVKLINPDTTVMEWTYNSLHRVLTATDEMDRVTEFTYDADGNMLTREDNAGNVWTYTVNSRGQVLAETTPDPDGAGGASASVTAYAYDASGRLDTITWPDTEVTDYGYNSADMVTSITDELLKTTTFTYDALDRMTGKTLPDPDGAGGLSAPAWTYKYNALGLLIEEIDALSNDTDYEYNTRNWLTKITRPDPDGAGSLGRPEATYTYDNAGNMTGNRQFQMSGPAQGLGYTFNDAGWVTQITGPVDNYSETLGYDRLGRLTSREQNPPNGRTIQYQYDSRGRLTKVIDEDPDGGGQQTSPETTYTYNIAGQISTVTDPLGRLTSYDYTEEGWLNSVTLPDPDSSGPNPSPIYTYGYDAIGRQTGVTDPLSRGISNTVYDSRHRVVSVTGVDPDGAGGSAAPVTDYDYDDAGRLSSVTDPLDRVTAYAYDYIGRLLTVTLPDPDGAGGASSPVHTYAYNALGNVTTYTDPAGKATTTTYDNLQRQLTVTEPDPDAGGGLSSPVWTYTYGANTLLSSVTDPEGNTTTLGYDNFGRKTTSTTDLGYVTTFAYDTLSRMTSVTTPDPDGAGSVTASVTAYGYDIYDRLTSITDALSGATTFAYDKANQLLTLDDPENNTTTWAYDNLGRVTMETNELNDTRSFYHDAVGNLTRKVDRNERVTQYVYDNLDRMTEEKWINNGTPVPTIAMATTTQGGALNEVQRVGYSISGSLMGGNFKLTFGGQETGNINYNASASDVQTALEALSNIGVGDVTVTRTQSGPMAFEWQITFTGALAAADQSQVSINTGGISFFGTKTNIQATDQIGQPASTDEVQTITLSNATGGTFRLAFGGQTTAPLDYDATNSEVESALEALTSVDNVNVTGSAGGPWTVTFAGTHADTNVATIQGDAATAESGSVARTMSFEYDLANQLTKAGDSDSGYDFTYDNLGRILTMSNADTPNLPDVVLTNVYDSRSNRTSVSAVVNSTNDFKTDYTYDDLSRMTRLEQNGNGGNTVASKRANFEYNGLGQFTKITREYKPSGTWTEVATSHYTYDDDNRLTGLAYKRNNTDMFTAYAWTYDNMGRVSQMTGQDGTSTYTYDKTSQVTAVDHSFQTDESYTFDTNGNREDANYTVGTNNQMTSDGTYDYTYDDEGNLTRRTVIATGYYREFVWDHRNRLTQVLDKDDTDAILKQFDYKYDVFDRRIHKSVDNDGPGAGAAVVSRYVYDGDDIVLEYNGSNTLTHRYVHGPDVDQIFADEDATNAILWPLADNLGTVRDLSNSTGTIQNHIKYESFGKVTSESNSAVNHLYGFTGRERDEEAGLSYHRGRYYDPLTGKWISEDPSGFDGGDANLSRYVLNSPTNYVDPHGLSAQTSGQMVVVVMGSPYTWNYDTNAAWGGKTPKADTTVAVVYFPDSHGEDVGLPFPWDFEFLRNPHPFGNPQPPMSDYPTPDYRGMIKLPSDSGWSFGFMRFNYDYYFGEDGQHHFGVGGKFKPGLPGNLKPKDALEDWDEFIDKLDDAELPDYLKGYNLHLGVEFQW